MFFQVSLKYNLNLPPKALTNKLRDTLELKLREAIEGKVNSTYGYILMLLGLDSVGQGRVSPDTGDVVFTVHFRALVFKPFKNEVVDGHVIGTASEGIHVSVGPLRIFIHRLNLPKGFEFDPSTSPPAWVSSDTGTRIQYGSELRVRISSTTVSSDSNTGVLSIQAVGTAALPFLGLLQ
ncbi:hypothetical protein P9112_008951 [Eukaryota sp. TZLM1-RC]